MSKRSELEAALLKIVETIVEITLEMVSLHAASGWNLTFGARVRRR